MALYAPSSTPTFGSGVPSDGLYSPTPPDGQHYVDQATGLEWVRDHGSWSTTDAQSGTYVPKTGNIATPASYAIEFDQTGGNGQPFCINFDTTTLFNSTRDPIMKVGINQGPGGGDQRINTSHGAAYIQFEGDYESVPGTHNLEWHLIFADTTGAQTRTLTSTLNLLSGLLTLQTFADDVYFNNRAATNQSRFDTSGVSTTLWIDSDTGRPSTINFSNNKQATNNWQLYSYPSGANGCDFYIQDAVTSVFALHFQHGSNNTTGQALATFEVPVKMNSGVYAGGTNVGGVISYGTGAPVNASGVNGDIYLRVDGGSLTTIYQRRAGAWVGIV